MQTFINNLGQDIASIDEFLEQIERDKAQGFDVGTSEKTLLFQKATLDIDLQFYTSMKKTYLSKQQLQQLVKEADNEIREWNKGWNKDITTMTWVGVAIFVGMVIYEFLSGGMFFYNILTTP